MKLSIMIRKCNTRKQNSILGVVLGITMLSVSFYTLTAITLNVSRVRVVAPFERRLPRIRDFTKRNSKNKNKKETKFFAKKNFCFCVINDYFK
jgi:hypothetical protein